MLVGTISRVGEMRINYEVRVAVYLTIPIYLWENNRKNAVVVRNTIKLMTLIITV